MGQAVLSAVDVVTGLLKDPAVSLAAAAITKKVDGAVDEGVYQLNPDGLPEALKGSDLKRPKVDAAEDGGPLLVLIHGTFVDTISTFGKLWAMHRRRCAASSASTRPRLRPRSPDDDREPVQRWRWRAQCRRARAYISSHSPGDWSPRSWRGRAAAGRWAATNWRFDGAGMRHRTDLQALAEARTD
jgi:hypothetical protein